METIKTYGGSEKSSIALLIDGLLSWRSNTTETIQCAIRCILGPDLSRAYSYIYSAIDLSVEMLSVIRHFKVSTDSCLIDTYSKELATLIQEYQSYMDFLVYPFMHEFASRDWRMSKVQQQVSLRHLVLLCQKITQNGYVGLGHSREEIWICHMFVRHLNRELKEILRNIQNRSKEQRIDIYEKKKNDLCNCRAMELKRERLEKSYQFSMQRGDDMELVYLSMNQRIDDDLNSADLVNLRDIYKDDPCAMAEQILANHFHEHHLDDVICSSNLHEHLDQVHSASCERNQRNSLNGQEQKRRTFVKSVIVELLKRRFIGKPVISTFGHWYYVYLMLVNQKIYQIGDYTQFIADLEWLQTEDIEIPKMPDSTYLSKESATVAGVKFADWKFPNPSSEPAKHKMFIGQAMNQIIKPFLQLLK